MGCMLTSLPRPRPRAPSLLPPDDLLFEILLRLPPAPHCLHRASACLYSSETDAWGRLITAEARSGDVDRRPSALVGDALYWVLDEGDILELHLGKESLAVVEPPPGALAWYGGHIQLMDAADSALGLAGMDVFSLQLWAREAGPDGIASCWVLRKTIDLDMFAPQQRAGLRVIPVPPVQLLGVDEDGICAFIWTIEGIFMVHLEDKMLKKVSGSRLVQFVYPYSSFYVAVMAGGEGEDDGANHGSGRL